MTKFFCDMCKTQLSDGLAPTRMQVGEKMHEFCNECWVGLRKMLEGTGTPAVQIPIANNGPLVNYPVSFPKPDLWKDMLNNKGISLDPNIQITYGTNAIPNNASGALTDLNGSMLNSLDAFKSVVNSTAPVWSK